MAVANCYEQWAAAGFMLDRCENKDVWKNDENCSDYDCDLVKDRLDMLRSIRKAGDTNTMLFTLRTSLSRNLGEMGNPNLYAWTHVGTKTLIEDYIDEVTKQLNFICDVDVPGMDLQSKLEFFSDTQKSFGRTALLFSGGGVLGLSHAGVAKALIELKLMPRVIAGSSAGSIIAAGVGTRTDEEIYTLLDPKNLQLDVFEVKEEYGNPFIKLARFLKHGVIYDGQIISETMKFNMGDYTFLEAFNKTRRVLNITVSSSTAFEMPRLLNYLTAPNVFIWSAVAASCAVPFVFRPAALMCRDKNGNTVPWSPSGVHYYDGSIEGDLPMQRLSELFGVNHFMVAQVNPYIIPFFSKGNPKPPGLVDMTIDRLAQLAFQELAHRLTQLTELGIAPDLIPRVKSILTQKYTGDITIVPSIPWIKFPFLLTNPNNDFYRGLTVDGELATWPKIAIMRNHLQIELCLTQNIRTIREKIVALGSPRSIDFELSHQVLLRQQLAPNFQQQPHSFSLSITNASFERKRASTSNERKISFSIGSNTPPEDSPSNSTDPLKEDKDMISALMTLSSEHGHDSDREFVSSPLPESSVKDWTNQLVRTVFSANDVRYSKTQDHRMTMEPTIAESIPLMDSNQRQGKVSVKESQLVENASMPGLESATSITHVSFEEGLNRSMPGLEPVPSLPTVSFHKVGSMSEGEPDHSIPLIRVPSQKGSMPETRE